MKINQKKSEVMVININEPLPIEVSGVSLKTTKEFTYLGSKLTEDGGSNVDIRNRLNKARTAFVSMKNIWKSSQYGAKTKIRIYQSCVLSTLLYGSECWRMTEKDMSKLSAFHTQCLRRILRIFWPNTISNERLLAKCNQSSMEDMIIRRRWQWLGHVLRRRNEDITREALNWTPNGKRRRGRPLTTWRRTINKDIAQMNLNWIQIEKLAQERRQWKKFVAALRAYRHNRNE